MDATLQLKAEQLASEIATQAMTLDGLLRTLLKSALERMLDTELDGHLGRKALPTLPADVSPSPLHLPGLDATNWRAELAIRFGVILVLLRDAVAKKDDAVAIVEEELAIRFRSPKRANHDEQGENGAHTLHGKSRKEEETATALVVAHAYGQSN